MPPAVSLLGSCPPAYERLARRRRRRRGALPVTGSQAAACSPAYRSIRMTGRMTTVAGRSLPAADVGARAARSIAGKVMTVPMSIGPRP